MLIPLIACAIAVAIIFGYLQVHDANISEEGFAKGYTEANELLTFIFRTSKPSSLQLQLANVVTAVLIAVPMSYVSWWDSVFAVALLALKHEVSIRSWEKVFATNGACLNEPRSAWKKFLGTY